MNLHTSCIVPAFEGQNIGMSVEESASAYVPRTLSLKSLREAAAGCRRRGKRRIHATPKAHEIRACRPWLEAELKVVQPSLVVALGATAAQTILGSGFRLTQHRGEILESEYAGRVLATLHPSAILRAPDQDARDEAMRGFIADLKSPPTRRLAAKRRTGRLDGAACLQA
jgi:Uracil DNA glycosylase superfamily